MYQRCMAIAFLTNGMGVFGLRVLAAAGLGQVNNIQYLAYWYAAGLLVASVLYFRRYGRPRQNELAIGSGLAIASLAGQVGMAQALTLGVPGFVVFPVATGGGMILVVLVGVFVFREPMRPLGYLGIATGLTALVLLALPG